MAPYTHPGTSREVNEARWPQTCIWPCAFEEKKKSKKETRKKYPPHPKHSTKSTAARRPRLTRDGMQGQHQLILSRFHRSRVWGNRHRTAPAISNDDECYTCRDRQNVVMAPCTHPGMKGLFCLKANNGVIMMSCMC